MFFSRLNSSVQLKILDKALPATQIIDAITPTRPGIPTNNCTLFIVNPFPFLKFHKITIKAVLESYLYTPNIVYILKIALKQCFSHVTPSERVKMASTHSQSSKKEKRDVSQIRACIGQNRKH